MRVRERGRMGKQVQRMMAVISAMLVMEGASQCCVGDKGKRTGVDIPP